MAAIKYLGKYSCRVTKLGKFFPIGWLFTLVIILKITEKSDFIQVMYELILAINVLGEILDYFLQTHLVTPVTFNYCAK
jgi:hypothetical protein